ncbi:MAG: ParB/RepB/Spo0J family partition protein [Ancrocorticia sp.]|jgi:ParB family chromosome partitioning protein|nr:ParB/RepB/Spo0J family partition protein [Ancrocorticia sp.]MCI1963630.1 ParB/RepB/Spo0J family partition protein [Ancrocorticia sp.]MCI2002781.1 ParB/RepB/Spo0J family partition protein [Ancrocorticia sp.]MCI2012101.1 ParB/RepB/Spo0J family partition protein [Ancrocorticia sp.]MCI2029792.1 ParB/RepB/Spo0J family partition protein [Ancrocorticia sp.]
MAQRRRGLGRGIGALIPESQEEVRESPISVFFGGAVSRETEEVTINEGDVEREGAATGRSGNGKKTSAEVSRETPKTVSRETDKKKTATPATSSGKTEEQALENENELVPVPGATYAELPVSAIIPNRKQPRSVFDDDELNELADSIRQVGVLQPVIVRPLDEPIPESPSARYELIMGERRWRASERAEMETIPAIVRRTADEDLLRDALLENLHRAQLNPLEEAAAYQQLLDDFGCSQEELSKRIARSRPQISNTLRLLKLPPLVQRRVAAHVISAGHARALLGLSDPAAMERLAQRIVAEGLSVRQVEEIVAVGDEPSITPARHRRAKRYASELGELSVRLADRFDTKVKVELGQYKGAIRIDFASIDDLNRILRILAPEEDDISISE